MKDLHNENSILKKLKKILEGETIHATGLVKINVVKLTILLKAFDSHQNFNKILHRN